MNHREKEGVGGNLTSRVLSMGTDSKNDWYIDLCIVRSSIQYQERGISHD